MKLFNSFAKGLAWLDGKKTYIVSGLTTLDGVVQLVQGHNWNQIIPFVLAGAFGAALRAAVAKSGVVVEVPVATKK